MNDITVDTLFKYAEALGLSAIDLLSYSLDEAKGIYHLGFDCLPTLPNVHDCKVERITVGKDSLLLVFEKKRISPAMTRFVPTTRKRIR